MSAPAPAGLAALRRTDGLVHVFGHRGARGVFAENTMPGFRYTFELGLTAVEFDVLVTADRVAVLTHNPELLPETTRDPDGAWLGGPGPQVHRLPYAELARYDVGAVRHGTPYFRRFPEQARMDRVPIPTLDDLCALTAAHPGVWLDLEIKCFATQPEATWPPRESVEAVLGPLRAHGLEGRTLMQSFDWRVLSAARELAPDIPRAYLSCRDPGAGSASVTIYPGSPWMDGCDLDRHGGSLPRAIAALGGAVWCAYHRDLDRAAVSEAHDLGLVVTTWTVNEPDELQRMAEIGVDGIITDFPARAQAVLDGMGLGWRHPPG